MKKFAVCILHESDVDGNVMYLEVVNAINEEEALTTHDRYEEFYAIYKNYLNYTVVEC